MEQKKGEKVVTLFLFAWKGRICPSVKDILFSLNISLPCNKKVIYRMVFGNLLEVERLRDLYRSGRQRNISITIRPAR